MRTWWEAKPEQPERLDWREKGGGWGGTAADVSPHTAALSSQRALTCCCLSHACQSEELGWTFVEQLWATWNSKSSILLPRSLSRRNAFLRQLHSNYMLAGWFSICNEGLWFELSANVWLTCYWLQQSTQPKNPLVWYFSFRNCTKTFHHLNSKIKEWFHLYIFGHLYTSQIKCNFLFRCPSAACSFVFADGQH